MHARPSEHQVAEVAYLLDVCSEVGVDGEDRLPPVSDAFMAPIRVAAFQLHRVRDELHVGVTEREECIEVPSIEGVIRSLGEFDDVRQHRPSSIYARFTLRQWRPPR
jgi:hypothetical protein